MKVRHFRGQTKGVYPALIVVLVCVILAGCGGPTLYKRPAEMTLEEGQRHLDECQEQARRVWASQSSLERCMASRGFIKQ
jgi:hypothetical protein